MATPSIRNNPLKGKIRPIDESLPNFQVNFWARVAQASPDECWEWQAARSSKEYGGLKFNGVPAKAHRVAFYLTYGKWPTPFCLHKCDNPPCCNPNHLEEGSPQDNATQAKERGRLRPRRGNDNGRAILQASDIPAIRELIAIGTSLTVIARQFGVTRPVIYQIKCGKNWASIG